MLATIAAPAASESAPGASAPVQGCAPPLETKQQASDADLVDESDGWVWAPKVFADQRRWAMEGGYLFLSELSEDL